MTSISARSTATALERANESAPHGPRPASEASPSSIDQVLARLHAQLRARHSVFFAADAARRTLTAVATRGALAERFRPVFGRGVAGRVADSGRPIVVPSVGHEPMALLDLAQPSTRQGPNLSVLAVPVLAQYECIGVLSAYLEGAPEMDFSVHLRHLRAAGARIADLVRSEREAANEPPIQLTEMAPEYSNLIGASAVMRQLYEQVSQVARTTATVLIRGESGTGKELVATAIHDNSARADQPFVRVNCAAIPETLFESELFGHERGAFTGAHARKIGRFELAQRGTLFLDELGELPVATQVKLLRVLQSREFERLGGTGTLRTDVRLIAATNKDLERAVAEGSFREDLYYRLNVFTISLPRLRERAQDIPALAMYFLQKYATEHTRPVRHIEGAALDSLCHYAWPGNVRELENAIERAVVVCDGSALSEYHLPDSVRCSVTPAASTRPSLAAAVEDLERRMIAQALSDARGNLARAARSLGATERVVRYKVGKYGMAPATFRK